MAAPLVVEPSHPVFGPHVRSEKNRTGEEDWARIVQGMLRDKFRNVTAESISSVFLTIL
jgi:hypothetical protein